MSERISAGAIPPGKRVSAADLTPMERDKLTTEGRVGPDGFVDIAEPEKPQVIDMKAAARHLKIRQMLEAQEFVDFRSLCRGLGSSESSIRVNSVLNLK